MNPLRESGKPLFFRVANDGTPGLTAPAPVHGLSLRVAVRSLSTMQKEALVCNSVTSTVWRLASDEGAYLAGQDEAPCPLAFFTTGMVALYCEEIQALARQRDINIHALRLVLDNYYTMKGSALRGTMTGGARDIHLQAWIEADASQESLEALVADAVTFSPINGLLRKPLASYFTLSHNGNRIALARKEADEAQSEPESVLPDPLPLFAGTAPAAGFATADLVVRKGMAPETAETVTRAGDSLQAEQDRVLHIRGICTVRDDGIKEIEQQLFNPHGSIFRFLCEEGVQNGGKGRAPDAASYLVTGIAFCFMTQLGRYAQIMKKDLSAYRIVQDTHFSIGGSGKPGIAEPVQTHVFLESAEDSAFARKMLEMGEQTCFLHAFCRTALDADIRVNVPD